ncbi:MAG: GMC family oxidoreductase N-terminal domain-containing protein [Blastocatellia bacterium]|nr:GMC family oxidoreductase N-terminal domain-containing protein [Blastocatellia bacterium]
MNRREWLRYALSIAATPILPRLTAGQAAKPLPEELRKTLAAIAETILPATADSPGANGTNVIRMVEERIGTDRRWLALYQTGLKKCDRFVRDVMEEPFYTLSTGNRYKLLDAFHEAVRGSDHENFLKICKLDALNELFTTRAGLKWLGYPMDRVQGSGFRVQGPEQPIHRGAPLQSAGPQNSKLKTNNAKLKNEAPVLVVGGGAAGMTVAYRLAMRGIPVEVLEFGPLPKPLVQFQNDVFPEDLPFRGLGRNNREYYEPDHFTAERNAPYQIGQEVPESWLKRTRVAGGKTLYWTGHALRFSDFEFRSRALTGQGEDWPLAYAELAPYYQEIEKLMGVCGSPAGLIQQPDGVFLPPLPLRKGELALQDVLGRIGIRLISARKAILTKVLGNRPACHFSERCFLGCNTSAKFDAFTGLAQTALETGKLRIRPDSVALELVCNRHGRIAGVRIADRLTHKETFVAGRAVVLAASPVETAKLLLSSPAPDGGHGLANRSGLVGAYLTESMGVRVEGLLEQFKATPVETTPSTGEHGVIPRFVNLSKSSKESFGGGFLFLTQSGPEIFPAFAASLPGFGADFKEEIRRWYPAAVRLYGIGSTVSQAKNRVVLDPARRDEWNRPTAKTVFSLSDEDLALWQAMSDRAQEFLDFAGADMITVAQPGPETGGGLHAAGTCRMGTDPKTSVVNPFGQTHDVKNLFVADASVFVSSLNQPTLTVMALALRTADCVAEQLRDENI